MTIVSFRHPVVEKGNNIVGFYYRASHGKKKHDSIMVVADKFSKEAHFIPVKFTYKVNNIVRIFMEEIFKLHGIQK